MEPLLESGLIEISFDEKNLTLIVSGPQKLLEATINVIAERLSEAGHELVLYEHPLTRRLAAKDYPRQK